MATVKSGILTKTPPIVGWWKHLRHYGNAYFGKLNAKQVNSKGKTEMKTENIVSRGFTQVEFTDQYGDKRTIYRQKGAALRVKKNDDTVSHKLNRAAAELTGDLIKSRRIKAGMTLDGLLAKAGLAAGAGQGKSRMYEIENAGRNRKEGFGRQSQGMRFGTLYALAIALECDVADLLPSASAVAARAGVALTTPNTVRLSSAA